jgi:septal ring factor EnvC (AmiA/AmiB activator)
LKTRLTIICLFLIAISAPVVAEESRSDKRAQPPEPLVISENGSLSSILAIPPSLPRGPRDRLKDYEDGMAAIAQQFSARLRAIVEGVETGRLTREQGEHISGEQYYVSRMQFELLSASHEMLQHDLDRVALSAYEPAPSDQNETLTVALPFSSLQLDPSLARHLHMTSEQVKAIEKIMSEERRNLEPLMAQMRATKARLVAARNHRQAAEKEISSSAAAQAVTLARLIVANSRMEARLYELLSLEQRRKLDAFKRSNQLSLRAAEY